MTKEPPILRLLVSTGSMWRADLLAEFLAALDGVVCRAGAACLVSDLLRRHNEELANLQAMGLLRPGLSPAEWQEATRGTDALTRDGYLQIATALRNHGIGVHRESLGWRVELEFEDIIEIVPRSLHLEVDFIEIASPGILSLLQVGLKAVRESADLLKHIFDSWIEPEAARRLRRAAAEVAEQQARVARERANQEAARTRAMRAAARRLEEELRSCPPATVQSQLDYRSRSDAIRSALAQGGLTYAESDRKVLAPLEQGIDRLARLRCDGLITGIAVDLLEPGEDTNERDITRERE